MFNNFRQPHLPQTHVDGSVFCPMNCPWAKILQFSKSSDVAKKCPRATKPNFKSRPMWQKVSTGNKTKFSKSSDVARNCPRTTKPNSQSRPMSQKSVHVQQNQILKVVRCRKKLSTGNKIKF